MEAHPRLAGHIYGVMYEPKFCMAHICMALFSWCAPSNAVQPEYVAFSGSFEFAGYRVNRYGFVPISISVYISIRYDIADISVIGFHAALSLTDPWSSGFTQHERTTERDRTSIPAAMYYILSFTHTDVYRSPLWCSTVGLQRCRVFHVLRHLKV
jgi:hypothetical protein